MIEIICGDKGKGKTKELLDKVNSSIKGNEGSIVFLDKSQKHMYELNNQVRLINVMDYPIDNCDEFLGFICGIISQDHDLEEMETELNEIRKQGKADFQLIAVKVDNWNQDLSPWEASAVFGREGFGDGAGELLQFLLGQCVDRRKTYYIGGYSLAGLFSLWAAYQTDIFAGVAAVSPSVWFPGFLQYMKEHDMRAKSVYLSLGNREERTRNPLMATVGDCIREGYNLLKMQKIRTILEWNPGNHFKDAGIRTAKGFAWLIRNQGAE